MSRFSSLVIAIPAGGYRTPESRARIATPMTSRRNFLGIAGLAAAWPEAAWPQAKPRPPKPKPEGVLVNDVHSQLNTTRVFRVMEPDSPDGVRSAFGLARKEE